MPVEPPGSIWNLPDPALAPEQDLVAVGADLEPGTLLAAYRAGLFPMPMAGGVIGWFSPVRRGIVPLNGLRISTSLRRSCRRLSTTVDKDFEGVITGCASLERPDGWITPEIKEAYEALHRLGWAHSVETWNAHGELVGGLYGVSIGGFFAGESMFHRATDASKVALVRVVEELQARGSSLLDIQWQTPHLASLGAIEIDRAEYLDLLHQATSTPQAFE